VELLSTDISLAAIDSQIGHFNDNIFACYFWMVYPKVGNRSVAINMQFAATFVNIFNFNRIESKLDFRL
jgi:hypothetical protein